MWFVTLGCGVLFVLLCSLLLHLTLFGVFGVVVVCCVVLVCVVSFCGGFALAWCCCVVFCYCVALLCWVVHSDYCICMHALCLPCDAVCIVLFRNLTVMFVGVVVLCFVLVPRFVLPCICLSCFCVFCSLLSRHLFSVRALCSLAFFWIVESEVVYCHFRYQEIRLLSSNSPISGPVCWRCPFEIHPHNILLGCAPQNGLPDR